MKDYRKYVIECIENGIEPKPLTEWLKEGFKKLLSVDLPNWIEKGKER